MPIRIYALAKDLKIDSKELVEFCNKAGIPGKGSALASLEDDEIAKLKSWMDTSATKTKPSGPAPLVDTKTVLSSPVSATATLPPPMVLFSSAERPVAGVAKERVKPCGRVGSPCRVGGERLRTDGRIRAASRVYRKRSETGGCVVRSGRVAH